MIKASNILKLINVPQNENPIYFIPDNLSLMYYINDCVIGPNILISSEGYYTFDTYQVEKDDDLYLHVDNIRKSSTTEIKSKILDQLHNDKFINVQQLYLRFPSELNLDELIDTNALSTTSELIIKSNDIKYPHNLYKLGMKHIYTYCETHNHIISIFYCNDKYYIYDDFRSGFRDHYDMYIYKDFIVKSDIENQSLVYKNSLCSIHKRIINMKTGYYTFIDSSINPINEHCVKNILFSTLNRDSTLWVGVNKDEYF